MHTHFQYALFGASFRKLQKSYEHEIWIVILGQSNTAVVIWHLFVLLEQKTQTMLLLLYAGGYHNVFTLWPCSTLSTKLIYETKIMQNTVLWPVLLLLNYYKSFLLTEKSLNTLKYEY